MGSRDFLMFVGYFLVRKETKQFALFQSREFSLYRVEEDVQLSTGESHNTASDVE